VPRALVTGGASGIGFATAGRLAAAGYDVLIWDKDAAAASAAAGRIGARATGTGIDVADLAAVRDATAAIAGQRGGLAAVVANAGISGHGAPFAAVDPAAFDAMMNVHVRGHFFLLQGLLPALGPGAAIVLVSSIYARIGVASMPHYAAAKGALLALTKALAAELGPRGVRVNAVTPGLVRTPMTEASARGDEAFFAGRAAALPLRRLTTPDEVAATILWLLSAEASSLTGQALSPSGGEVMAD
jgi:3-oxoacyl-[acyl-carrier protein] reductase